MHFSGGVNNYGGDTPFCPFLGGANAKGEAIHFLSLPVDFWIKFV
jgi:hypothetical protein